MFERETDRNENDAWRRVYFFTERNSGDVDNEKIKEKANGGQYVFEFQF